MTSMNADETMETISCMNSALLGVHAQRCMLVRNRNAECLACAAVCTTGAISRTENGISIDPERCIGCGTCASVCPTCCLEPLNPTDGELSERLARALGFGAKRIAVICKTAMERVAQNCGNMRWQLNDGTDVIVVECLGRAEESLLVEAVVRGAERITLISDSCSSCAHVAGGTLCDEICASTKELLSAFESSARIERTHASTIAIHPAPSTPSLGASAPKDEAKQEAEARFASASREACQSRDGDADCGSLGSPCSSSPHAAAASRIDRATPPHLAHVQSDGTLPHHLPERRLRLYNCLKRLGKPRKEEITTRLWGQVSINDDLCQSCRMCMVFCPTGALSRFDDGNGAFGVEHRPALCVQCRMCESICPEGAIGVSDSVSLDTFLSGRKVRFSMKPLDWNPGSPEAIATRMARFIKTDALQDSQAKIKPQRLAEQRARALERQRVRDEAKKEQERP